MSAVSANYIVIIAYHPEKQVIVLQVKLYSSNIEQSKKS